MKQINFQKLFERYKYNNTKAKDFPQQGRALEAKLVKLLSPYLQHRKPQLGQHRAWLGPPEPWQGLGPQPGLSWNLYLGREPAGHVFEEQPSRDEAL